MGRVKFFVMAASGLILSVWVDSIVCADSATTMQPESYVEQRVDSFGDSEGDFDKIPFASELMEDAENTDPESNKTDENKEDDEFIKKSTRQERNIRRHAMTEGDNDVIIAPQKAKRRRHMLRRKTQQCSITCFNNSNCIANANSNFNCNDFRICNANGFCQSNSRSGNRCNWNCQNNRSICNGASDGCSYCNGFQCTRGPNRQRCGQFCANQPWICNDATDGCTTCNGSTCSGNRGAFKCGWNCQGNPGICNGAADGCTRCNGFQCVGSGGGQPRCGRMCRNNPNICNVATDGCTICNGSTGTCTSGGRPTCGSTCFGVNSCLNALGGCTQCLNGICDSNRSGGGACESTEAGLRARLENGGTIQICSNARIVVNTEIVTNRSNILLQCQGGGTGCAIVGNQRNRLIRFTGQSIEIRGITFQNGFSTQSGGAIYIDGNNNRITNCSFVGNRANQQGGAASVGSTTFAGNTFAGNFASQCINIFQRQTGQCFE